MLRESPLRNSTSPCNKTALNITKQLQVAGYKILKKKSVKL